MRPALLISLAAACVAAGAAAWSLRPARAEDSKVLYVSGMRIAGDKPIAKVRLTNTSPNAADVFTVHYTVRDPSAGIALSEAGAGLGAQLLPGHVLEIDLGKVVSIWRTAHEVGPYAGPIQFVAYGEGGFTLAFGPDTVHVEATQQEGAAVYEGVAQWLVQ
jgi:hypothetical protein